jgi:hypothetical protein
MAQSNARQAIVGLVTLAVVVGGILGGVYLYRRSAGGDIGAKCEDNFSCKPGGICISKRCQQGCKKDDDCPAGWSCRNADVWVSGRDTLKADTRRICFSPEQMAPARAREAAERSQANQRQAEIDLILKRQRVFNKVLLKTLPLPGKPAVQVSNAAFDAAWTLIPQADQIAQSDDTLADRVIKAAGKPR